MGEYQAMMDAIRDGMVNKARASCPSEPGETYQKLWLFLGRVDGGDRLLPGSALLETPLRNLDIDRLTNVRAHRACLRVTEMAVVMANYIRLLGWDAMAHTAPSRDVDNCRCRGATIEQGALVAPYLRR